jgi:curli biogenesis system outer membrane secretion channel CsgG
MRRISGLIFYLSVAVVLSGCAAHKPLIKPQGSEEMAYLGLKAKVAVADFQVKAAKATSEIGLGLREMLVTALVNSNRFSVLERQQLSALRQEQEISASGSAQGQESSPQRGKIKSADLIIAATLTEFEPQVSGGRAGIGGGGGAANGVLGALLGAALNKAHLALDIRIVDTATSEILTATRVQGQATDIAGVLGDWTLSIGLSAYAKTPMEKAIRVCIAEAVPYIIASIPESYYKN